VPLLLEYGANVAETDDSGRTALHLAAQDGRSEVVRLFLEHGAEAKAKDENASTALSMAAANGHEAIAPCSSRKKIKSSMSAVERWVRYGSYGHEEFQ
jgi:ankyrin repeat protein